MSRLLSEFVGSAFLLSAIVGSGIMADNLANGDIALSLLAHAIAVGAMLFVLITMLGPLSGAHFNPAVTLAFWLRGEHETRDVAPYIAAQIAGACVGVIATRLMFEMTPIDLGEKARTGAGQWMGEVIATFGLMLVILLTLKARADTVPTSVALYVASAIWFTSSTCFANPAVTIARALSDTFTSISPWDVPMFIIMQVIGAGLAVGAANIMLPREEAQALREAADIRTDI
ncbi:MAG: MIP/aquaporin family protein [Pseudomonadota bacterium]